jgi:thiol-disulfide isomerase/thioredoxin
MKGAFFLATAFMATAITATKAGTPLKVGDAAPNLQPGKWVQGGPVNGFSKSNVYIVEFWATWCEPCRASIPQLNTTYQRFKEKGLIVIGQDCEERNESLVEPFVKKMGDQMTYPVVLDDKGDGKTGVMMATWMEAAEREEIPTAFVVDKESRIAWIGHPMALNDSIIRQVLAGDYDLKRAALDYTERQNQKAWLARLSSQLNRALAAEDWDAAEDVVKKMETILPEEEQSHLGITRVEILLGKNQVRDAVNLAIELSDAHRDNASLGNALAWKLATQNDPSSSTLDAAAMIAARARQSSAGKDPYILGTLARVTFLQGKQDSAVQLQEEAARMQEGQDKEESERTLDFYKEHKLPPIAEERPKFFSTIPIGTPPPSGPRLAAQAPARPAPVQGRPWENTLKMKFLPVPGTKVLFSV